MVKKLGKRNFAIILALVAVLAIGVASAFFTDFGTKTNSFTVGNIDIELEEPNWNEANGTNITPNQVIAKDPQVENTGANDAFVFLEVTVPAATVQTANDDGSLNAAAKHDLFSYTVNGSWKLVETQKNADNTVYTYAYVSGNSMKALAKGATTEALFDEVTFLNVVEGQLDGQEIEIDVDAMGIQADDLGTTTPADVLNLIREQN